MRFLLIPLLLAAAAAAERPLQAQNPAPDPRLIFSTFQGGELADDARAVAVSPIDGTIYVAGQSGLRDAQSTPPGGDPLPLPAPQGYLAHYDASGRTLLWRVRIGASPDTVPRALATDVDGNVYLAGSTGAGDLPLLHPVQSEQTGGKTCFVMKFNPEGELQFSTLLGGSRDDEPNAIATDHDGNIYVAGRTTSEDFPVRNALQPRMGGGGQDAFLAKFTTDYQLAWSTYLGGASGTDNIRGITTGYEDSLFVTGESTSPELATEHAWLRQPVSGSSFAARIAAAGDEVLYFTYLGFPGGETTAQAIDTDLLGRAYIAGYTSSRQAPVTANAFQKGYAGGLQDAFLLRLDTEAGKLDYLTYLGGSTRGEAGPDETAAAVRVDAHGLVWVAGDTSSLDFPGKRALQPAQAGGQDAYLLRLDIDNRELISSTFFGGANRDSARGLALGPDEAATVAGVTASPNLPVVRAVQDRIGGGDDGFVAQFCDPRPSAMPEALFNTTLGQAPPAALTLTVDTGCAASFAAVSVAGDASWLRVTAQGEATPLKLRVAVNPEGLGAGEYKATIRVTVPASYWPVLEIPVAFTVSEP